MTKFQEFLEKKRAEVLERLSAIGLQVSENGDLGKPSDTATFQREFWSRVWTPPAWNPSLEKYFEHQDCDIDPLELEVEVELVVDRKSSGIFRQATAYWSIPVTNGYGRRLRFIVWDRRRGKVLGILGLCDPVIGLSIREKWIGWDTSAKNERLYHVMSAFVLGAVPPYNRILGGKLVALLAGSKVVRDAFRKKYKGRKTIIAGKEKKPELVLIDTMGAFGKSAIYNRLRGWKFVGYTIGLTHYHLSYNGIFEIFKEVLEKTGKGKILKRNRFGHGPNWKMRVIREACKVLGFDSGKLMNLGFKRAYYVFPLYKNAKEFLLGRTEDLVPWEWDDSVEGVLEYWKMRWGVKRAKGDRDGTCRA